VERALISRAGLTLAELVVTMALLSSAGLGLLAAFTSGLKLMQQSTNLSMATDLGKEMIEGIKAAGYDQAVVGDFDGRRPDPPDALTTFPAQPYPSSWRNDQQYTLRVVCEQHSPTTRLLRVEVFWGRTHRTSLSTMLHR
jgi:hypothetical protein